MDFTIWFLIGAAFVFFMQAGFAIVVTGFTRAKNAGNIIMKNLIDFCIGTVVFMLLGFSLLVGLEAVGHFCGVPNLGMFADFDAFITNENGLASNFVFNRHRINPRLKGRARPDRRDRHDGVVRHGLRRSGRQNGAVPRR